MKKSLLCMGLFSYAFFSFAGVNPVTVSALNDNTSFLAGIPGSANYVVAVSSGVRPANAPLTFHLTGTGSSPGLTAAQQTSGASPCSGVALCGSSFPLSAGQSCCLAFTLTSNTAGNYTLQPSVGTTPPTYSAQAPSPLNVSVGGATIISVSPTSLTLIEGGSPNCVTVTNLSSATAVENLSEIISPGSTVSLVNTGTTCTTTLAASGQCNYCFLPGDKEETSTVTISGNNITASALVNIAVGKATNTTITVPPIATIPVYSGTLGALGSLVVTNTGTNIAYNVHAVLPNDWLPAVTEDDSNCVTIAANGGTCTLTFYSTTPYLAQGGIMITGDNITTAQPTALAFTIQGYVVFALSSPSSLDPQVIDTYDLSFFPSEGEQWADNGATFTGDVQDLYDGFTNTGNIYGGSNVEASAAVSCYDSTNGGFANGWYLPAICQMGGLNQGAGCSNNDNNTLDNLFQLGFGYISGVHWSSTAIAQTTTAWYENFNAGDSGQSSLDWNVSYLVRCARSITY